MSVTKKIADFIVKANFSDFPEEAVKNASVAIMDCTGVALAGTLEPCTKIAMDWVQETGGSPECGLPSNNHRTSAPASALVWGTAAHALDFDDVLISLSGHPSVTLVPVIFSLGRKYNANGRRILEAYIVGLDVEGKLGRAAARAQYAAGWHATSTLGSLGAAAAAAKIMGLNAEKTVMAIGIAASLASGLRQNFGTMTKPLHAGIAAQNGVTAAMLAARGFTADASIIEAQFGFANVFCGPGRHDLGQATKGLGLSWEALDPGITRKKYPCCAFTHRSIDAILKIREENRIEADQVDSILCKYDRQGMQVLIHSRPKTGLEGKFSMQYCLAKALCQGKLDLDDFTDAAVAEPSIRDYLHRVIVEELPESKPEAQVSIVEVKCKNGQVYSCRVDAPRGAPGNPMSWSEISGKYRVCAGMVLSPGIVDRTLGLFEKMEDLESVSLLLDLIESTG
jgi:2-methylcitrate dehydratase PrpD